MQVPCYHQGHSCPCLPPSPCCEIPLPPLILSCPESWEASQWRKIIRRAQQIAEAAGSKLPLLVGLDSVHGANYVEVGAREREGGRERARERFVG